MLDNHADVYNVITGKPEIRGRGVMRGAMRLLCSYISVHFARDIRVKVLLTNPAVGWYKRCGFSASLVHDTFVEMKLDLAGFRPCTFRAASWEAERE
jgi:hypothetical protein